MPPINKYLLFFLLIFLVFTTQRSFAQYPGMREAYRNMDFQQMQQQMRWQMGNLNLRGADYLVNFKYTYTVTMMDGTKQEVDSKIYVDTIIHKHYLMLVNKNYHKTDSNRYHKIYPQQTKEISRSIYNNDGPDEIVKGIATDSCWLFKVLPGQITMYSYLSEGFDYQATPLSTAGIQFGNGPILKYTKENLIQMVGQDAEALVYIDKKDYLKAIEKFNKHAEQAAKQ